MADEQHAQFAVHTYEELLAKLNELYRQDTQGFCAYTAWPHDAMPFVRVGITVDGHPSPLDLTCDAQMNTFIQRMLHDGFTVSGRDKDIVVGDAIAEYLDIRPLIEQAEHVWVTDAGQVLSRLNELAAAHSDLQAQVISNSLDVGVYVTSSDGGVLPRYLVCENMLSILRSLEDTGHIVDGRVHWDLPVATNGLRKRRRLTALIVLLLLLAALVTWLLATHFRTG